MRRRLALIVAAASAVAITLTGRATDERNIRALQRHVGCTREEARRLYQLSREHGYGAAYAKVFPGRAIPGIAPYPTPAGQRDPDRD
jgi:hypothetical protein